MTFHEWLLEKERPAVMRGRLIAAGKWVDGTLVIASNIDDLSFTIEFDQECQPEM